MNKREKLILETQIKLNELEKRVELKKIKLINVTYIISERTKIKQRYNNVSYDKKMSKPTIKRIGNYYFCPVCKDRLLVDKKSKTYFCIHCGFSHKEV